MPRSIGILSAVAFVFALTAVHGAGPKQPTDSWTTPGTKWVYQTDAETYELVVESAEQKGDVKVIHLEQFQDGKLTMSDNWAIFNEGVCRTALTGAAGDPPAFLVKFPHKSGETWTSQTELKGGITLRQTFTARDLEIVKVPGGTFQAVRVEFTLEATGDPTVSAEYWFAQDVGIVKLRTKKGDGYITHELKSFTPGRE